MSLDYLLGGLTAAAILVYLLYVLLRAERY